jgi:hypothetical protein
MTMPTNNPQAQWEDYTTSGVTGLLGEAGFKEPEKYSKFISEYNPYKEIVAQKTYDTQMKQFGVQRDTLSKNYSNQLTGLLGQTESAQAKSGFASSGAINKASGQSRGNLGFEYMSGVKGLNLEKEGAKTGLWAATEGSRQDYMDNLYDQMAKLIEGGAKMETTSPTRPTGSGSGSAQYIPNASQSGAVVEGLGDLSGLANLDLSYLNSPEGQQYITWASSNFDTATQLYNTYKSQYGEPSGSDDMINYYKWALQQINPDDDDTGGGLVPGRYSLGGGDDNTDENWLSKSI